MGNINHEELRKEVIGPFKDLDEMRQVWERLREIGESTLSSNFDYDINCLGWNFGWTGCSWGGVINALTVSPPRLSS